MYTEPAFQDFVLNIKQGREENIYITGQVLREQRRP
jgi:hypothetical protein